MPTPEVISSTNSYAILTTTDDVGTFYTLNYTTGSFKITPSTGSYVSADSYFSRNFVQFYTVEDISFEVPEDDTEALEVQLFPVGQEVNLYIRKGNKTTGGGAVIIDAIEGTVYCGVRKAINVGRARRLAYTFMGGSYTPEAPLPSGLSSYLTLEGLE